MTYVNLVPRTSTVMSIFAALMELARTRVPARKWRPNQHWICDWNQVERESERGG
jgi:hypothetical protein